VTDLHAGVSSAPPVSMNGHRGRSSLGSPSTPAPLRARRRPAYIALGVALAAAGGVMTATLVARTGDRVAVLAVAQNVPVGSTITAQDLTVAHVAADSALAPVRAGDESSVVGQTAAVGLPAGSLLVRTDLTSTALPAPGQQLVGVAVKPGQLPARPLTAGDKVLVAQTPGDFSGSDSGGTTSSVPTIPATVVDVSPPESDGTVVVDLLVAGTQGPQVAAIASTGHVALLEQPANGGSS
jgi:hypothetical protein